MKNLRVYDKDFLKKKVVPFALATSLFSGGISYLAIDKSKDSNYVEMSEQVRQSVYYDNYEFQEKYTIDENSSIDDSINDKSLKLVENLDIDLALYEDIDYLKYCNNLKTLVIRNAQFLSKKDADIINKLKLDNLYLAFNADHIDVEGLNNDYDFKNLNCDNINISFENTYSTELKNYMLYIWGKNKFGNKEFNFENKYKYELIDKKINKIMRDKSIKKKEKDADTLMSALIGVCDYFKYDDKSFYSFAYGDAESDSAKKILEYNLNDLSSTLLDYKGSGVCINVTSILNAVLYKLEIETYAFDCIVNEMGHEMSIVNIDNDWKYIDATNFDERFKSGELGYKEYINENDKKKKLDYYKRLKTNVITKGNETYEKFVNDSIIIPYIDIEDLTQKDRRIIVDTMVNEGLDGQEVKHSHNIVVPVGIGFGAGLLAIPIPFARRRKEIIEEMSIGEQAVLKKEKLIRLREFIKNNRNLLTLVGGVASADYYLKITDFTNEDTLLLIDLGMGGIFITSSILFVYLGSYYLDDCIEKKEDNIMNDLLKKEAKKNEKLNQKLHKELEKEIMTSDSRVRIKYKSRF